MARVRTLILRAAGTNCDLETQHAWELAGAAAERIHLRRLIEKPALLDECQVLTIPGGFSFGDDISAGRIFAAQLERHLNDTVRAFVDSGRLVLGICNGFQILVKAGLLPNPNGGEEQPTCSVTYNQPAGFQDRWITLRAGASPCVFTQEGRTYEMPIAHGEGRVVFSNDAALQRVVAGGQAVLRYEGGNPNGSTADIAGICDPTGRILGLMPHPDRFVSWTQHPRWTSLPERTQGDGLAMFQRAVAYFN
jgi:phosphoribosylformylglycinamidine synthase